jgi:hypothetical protein
MFFPFCTADDLAPGGNAIDRREIMATEDDAPTASSGKWTRTLDRSASTGGRLGADEGCGGVVAAVLVATEAGGGVLRGVGADEASFGRELTALFSAAGAGAAGAGDLF